MATPSVLIVPMPIPRSQNAPHFDGKYVDDFLDLITQHGANAGITDHDKLVKYILQYSSDRVKDLIRYLPEFDPDVAGKTWNKAKTTLKGLYGLADETPDYSETMLRNFCKECSAKSSFTDKNEIETYHREFMRIAGPLMKKSKITDQQCAYHFITGIPSHMKTWFTAEVPKAKRKRTSPPTIAESIAILQTRFDPDSLTYDPWNETKERGEQDVSFDPYGNRQDTAPL